MLLKEKIIHESLKLFSLKGFLSTSIDDILKAANSSKGGFYNHFKSKEDLLHHVLDEARSIWRDRNLDGLKPDGDSMTNLKLFLVNFRDRYLKDAENFPGGCIFITLLVELKNQRPHLADEINKGFIGLKNMIGRNLTQARESGKLQNGVDTEAITILQLARFPGKLQNGDGLSINTEMLFNSILGATITYNTDKAEAKVDKAISFMVDYLTQIEA